MPIYMERHDVTPEVTPEMIAHLHQEDLKIQDQFGCKAMTYWFDSQRRTAFCLVEAPDADSLHAMHNHAHGQVPNSIIEVNPSLVESFLGRIEDPVKASDSDMGIIDESALRILMLVTLKLVRPGEQNAASLQTFIDQLNNGFSNLVLEHRGRMVKHTETASMASFRFATDAFSTASAVHRLYNLLKKEFNLEQLELKIGLSAGVPVAGKSTFFGNAITLVERMCRILKGEINIASEVKQLFDQENLQLLQQDEFIFCLSEPDERFLNALMDYAEKNWHNTTLKLDDFSRALGLSKSQLYRKMTTLTGQSPNSFINDYRLNEAAILLTRNAGNISEVAFQTGFSSPSYFSKCFRKKFGYLPYDYVAAIGSFS